MYGGIELAKEGDDEKVQYNATEHEITECSVY